MTYSRSNSARDPRRRQREERRHVVAGATIALVVMVGLLVMSVGLSVLREYRESVSASEHLAISIVRTGILTEAMEGRYDGPLDSWGESMEVIIRNGIVSCSSVGPDATRGTKDDFIAVGDREGIQLIRGTAQRPTAGGGR